MDQDELTATEKRYKRLLDEQVKARAAATRAVDDHTREIAELCVQARGDGVTMALLASFVKVWDPKRGEEGELRSVSRQSVDQLVAAHEGRQRAPRKRPKRTQPAGGINAAAFS